MSADFWAGYVSGVAGIVVGNPLDVLKVRQQSATRLVPSLSSPSSSLVATVPARSIPASHSSSSPSPSASLSVFRDLGTMAKGLPAPIITYGALNALLFWSYNRTLEKLVPPSSSLAPPSSSSAGSVFQQGGEAGPGAASPLNSSSSPSPPAPLWAHFSAGTAAGLATFVVSCPTELIKCRAQVVVTAATAAAGASPTAVAAATAATGATRTDIDGLRNTSSKATSWGIARDVWRSHGPKGFYVGGVVTGLRDAIGYGFYFWTYEATTRAWIELDQRRRRRRRQRGQRTSTAATATTTSYRWDQARILLCGGVAGVVTWLSVFPLDVVKSRVQTQERLLPQARKATTITMMMTTTTTTATTKTMATTATPMARVNGDGGGGGGGGGGGSCSGAWEVSRRMLRNEGPGAFFRGVGVCSVRAFVVNAVQWATYEWAKSAL